MIFRHCDQSRRTRCAAFCENGARRHGPIARSCAKLWFCLPSRELPSRCCRSGRLDGWLGAGVLRMHLGRTHELRQCAAYAGHYVRVRSAHQLEPFVSSRHWRRRSCSAAAAFRPLSISGWRRKRKKVLSPMPGCEMVMWMWSAAKTQRSLPCWQLSRLSLTRPRMLHE